MQLLPRVQHGRFACRNLHGCLEAGTFRKREDHLAILGERWRGVPVDDGAGEWNGNALLFVKLCEVRTKLGKLSFKYGQFGYAAALGNIMVIVIAIILSAYLWRRFRETA